MKYMAAVIAFFAVVVIARGAFVVLPAVYARPHHFARLADENTGRHSARQGTADEVQVLHQLHDLQASVAGSPRLPALLAQGKNAPESAVGANRHQYQLSLVYYGKSYRRAVIDGAMLAEGERLPSGGRLLAIHEDRVVVRDRTGRHTLAVPAAQLLLGSVQTVVPAQAKGTARP